jgi:VWFA-related protein
VFTLLTVALVAMQAIDAFAQTAPAPADGQPSATLKASTRLVVVDVLAFDKKGNRIPDLSASDFKVLEDGREQKISVFSFQQPVTQEAAGLPSLAASPLPPNVFRNAPRFRANSALNIILLDGLNSSLLEQAYVRSEMVNFLEKLPQGYPIAIFALGRKLQLLQDFTTDLTELKKVIRAFKGERSNVLPGASGTPDTGIELNNRADEIALMFSPELRSQIQQFAGEYTSGQMDERVARTLAALTSLGRMLTGYPGRKNLIWISDGVPLTVVPDVSVSHASGPNAGQAGTVGPQAVDETAMVSASRAGGIASPRSRRTYTDQLALLGNLFADAQIAVYPIDARGLVGSPFYDVANNLSGRGAGGLVTSMEGRQAEELHQAHVNMQEIAHQTGGRTFYNRNDIDNALRNDIEDGSTYYMLAYYPDNKNWNGKFRKIQVSARRPDLKLRHREGYFAVNRPEYMKLHPQQRDLDLSQSLSPDAPIATAVQFEATVDSLIKDGRKQVTVNYSIHPHSVQTEQGQDGQQRAQLDCVVEAFAAGHTDRAVKVAATRVDALMKPDVYKKVLDSALPCHVTLDLPVGQYFLRVAIRDNLTGMIGTLNAKAE